VNATAKGKEHGIEFITPDKALQDKAAEFRAQHLASVAGTQTERGVTNAEAKIARYQELLAKWEGLVANVGSAEELAELRYKEIWSNVDFASYGQ
jgi:hypothetical protein